MAMRRRELYDEDFCQWSPEQAAALRRLSAERWNGPLDLEHLAEEVEDLGAERRDAARSQLRQLREGCLKLQHSPASDPRAGWLDTIDHARAEISHRLTPTVLRDAEAQLPRLYAQAPRVARRALEQHGEGDATVGLPAEYPYALDQLLDEAWYPSGRDWAAGAWLALQAGSRSSVGP